MNTTFVSVFYKMLYVVYKGKIKILWISLSTGKVFNFDFISFFNEMESLFTELFQNKPSFYNHWCRPTDTLWNVMSFRSTKKTKLKSILRKRDRKAVLHRDVDRRQCVGWRVIPSTEYSEQTALFLRFTKPGKIYFCWINVCDRRYVY